MSAYDFDVLAVTDFRYAGGTTASIAQEIEIQARMGLRTGLIHIDTPYHRGTRWAPRIRALAVGGYAQVVDTGSAVRARLMVLRHPRVFEHDSWSIAARADHIVMVANQTYKDGARDKPYFDSAAVQRRLRAEFGVDPVWAPIGPMMRDSLALTPSPQPTLSEHDWCNVINVEGWEPEARAPHEGPLRIGRHSRDNFKKWPETREDLLAAYPDSPDRDVRVLGGAGSAIKVLRSSPRNWRVYPFNSLSPQQFLRELDVYVYHHHSGYEEAFGRAPLEALAAGLPVLTHPYFERLFGDTCIYCEPRDVPARLEELGTSPPINRAGIELVRERYEWQTHARRIAPFVDVQEPTIRSRPSTRPRVLFISSNGNGLGHLTRLMSIARRMPAPFEPVFLTLSSGVTAVRGQGYWVDHIPGPKSGALRDNPWLDYVQQRVTSAIRELSPVGVVFDGTFPYRGLCEALDAFPHIFKTWSRRAMWKPVSAQRAAKARLHARSFDLVLEPGEFAADVDDGFTRELAASSTQIHPVVLLGDDELLPRTQARGELGIEDDAVAVLLNLGAGNINSIDNVVTAVSEILRENPRVHLVAARSIIAAAKLPEDAGRITTIESYPLARVIRAFDACVVAPGYNSFHELLAYGIPTLFVPNEDTALDDQTKRAGWGANAGTNLACAGTDLAALRANLAQLLDPAARAAMTERCRALVEADGGAQAAALIAAGCTTGPAPKVTSDSRPPALRRALVALRRAVRSGTRKLRAGASMSPVTPSRTLFVLERGILATDAGSAAVRTIVELGDRAVCLASADDLQPLRRLGLWVELITDDLANDGLVDVDYARYAVEKARFLVDAYHCQTARIVGERGLTRQLEALRGTIACEPYQP